jgi:hypothetical protein
MYAKRHVVVRRVVAMSHCRSIQIEGLAYEPSDRAYCDNAPHNNAPFGVLRQRQDNKMTARQRCEWRFVVLSIATRRKSDSDIGCVVAIDNSTRN